LKLKKFTELQSKSGGFADRVERSNKILNDLEDMENFNPALFGETIAASVPLFGNSMLSPEKQRYEQAKRDFVTAVLRLESGAAILDSEFDRENKKYFPQFGDSPEVIAQKRVSRDKQFDILKSQSGGAYEEIQKSRDSETILSNHPEHGNITESDIETTMYETGLNRDQVLKALGMEAL